jgi:hypothetical protein
LSYIDRYLQLKPTSVWGLTVKGITFYELHNDTGALQYLHKAWPLAQTAKDKAMISDDLGIANSNNTNTNTKVAIQSGHQIKLNRLLRTL